MQPYLALKASAGSGKTFALTVRYISLLLLDAKPNEILTLTFTNKAAAQMSQRIYDTLLNLGDDEAILKAILVETNLSKQEIINKKQRLVEKFISSELSIYTIDKFINKILREFSGYSGINDDFEIKFDDEELLLYKFLTSLNEVQFESLISFAHLENKKLNSIVEIFKLLKEKNEKNKIVKYSKESYEAVKIAILKDANCIKEFVEKSALSKSAFNAVDFKTVEELLIKGKTWLTKESLSEFSYFKKAKPPLELDEKLLKLQQNITLYYQIQESYTLENLFKIFDDFKNFRDKYNKQRNSLEFSDITNIVYTLLENHIEKDFLYFRLDTKYNHILIDEFQDTSTLQFKILFHLIDEIISGNPEVFKTLFYVGDIKQSIYRFRGGTKELFDYVATIFQPLLKVELLDTNYRSSNHVVNFVNKTFQNLANYAYDAQKVNSKIDGFVEVCSIIDEKELFCDEVYKKVDELLVAGVQPNNIAILTYTNADVLAIYEYLKLKKPTLDIVTEMTSKLINQNNVKAVINAVKYLYFKEDIYKVNFNSLIGKKYFDMFDFTIDIKTIDLVTIIKKLSYFFRIVDENVIRLIELSKGYESITDFVYDIDKDDTPMVLQNKTGLTILTIFKSKGLEFDTVIVCDRVTKKVPNRASLLFEYNEIELQNIYYKRANRENFDRFYKEAINKEKKLVVADELNILYVALTRAKNNMVILKKEKSSVYEYLGDFQAQTIGTLFIAPQNAIYKKQTVKISYTPQNFGYQEKEKSELDDKDTIKARYFGIATHYCLEMMKNFDIKSLEKSILLTQNQFINLLTKEQFNDIFSRIQSLIGNTQFQSIINNSNFTKEQSLIFKNEHKIIDLLLQKEDSFIVVDYKTTLSQSYTHREQVQKYLEAIKNIMKTNNVVGYIVYLQQNNIELLKVK